MALHDFWFGTIAVLWIGYFFLEGFDFGVGVLLPVLGRTETDRRVIINTIGPVWDGNEVWLVTATGATFAAFPAWYATMFSGMYLALLLVLACNLPLALVMGMAWAKVEWGVAWNWESCASRSAPIPSSACTGNTPQYSMTEAAIKPRTGRAMKEISSTSQ